MKYINQPLQPIKRSAVLECRLRRAKEATARAQEGNHKQLWLDACELWDKVCKHPEMPNLHKRLYEVDFVKDFKEWLARGNKW